MGLALEKCVEFWMPLGYGQYQAMQEWATFVVTGLPFLKERRNWAKISFLFPRFRNLSAPLKDFVNWPRTSTGPVKWLARLGSISAIIIMPGSLLRYRTAQS